jgi:mitogen-activated protein kinase kinase 3
MYLFHVFSLQKKTADRPNYQQLLAHSFIVEHSDKVTDVATFVNDVLGPVDEDPAPGANSSATTPLPNPVDV